MLGLLLRSELIQSSAVRTWNCVTNIAHFFWYKLNNLRLPEMPRSRRRHHSRSRSRSHSHDRDREVKRRRIDSNDSHHRRSVSDEEMSAEDIIEEVENTDDTIEKKSEKKLTEIPEEEIKEKETPKKQNTLDCFIKKSKDSKGKQKKSQEKLKVSEEKVKVSEEELKDSKEESKVSEEDLKDSNEESKNNEEKTTEISSEDSEESDNSDVESEPAGSETTNNKTIDETLDSTLNDTKTDELDDSTVTPKKQNIKDSKLDKSSSKKLSERKLKLQEEREKKRLEAKENKEKLKLERQAQKIKERQEKEEQRKKERLEKEEQKRKEREEKEEQKKKEREEKEEQRKKEREEKEEQKKKEREEKEEQKRKEREERELKKQEELEKEKKKKEKEAAAFASFFVTRKSATSSELLKTEEIATSNFMPFEIKADMRLAPIIRCSINDDQKNILTNKLETQNEQILYLQELKNGKTLKKSDCTWPVEDNEVILLEDTDIGECVEEQPKISKMRAKLLKFNENRRPAYFGTWRKKSKIIKPRKPIVQDKVFFDYEVDSDDDWEEEEPGESLHGSDDEEKENESDEYEVDNEFFVPHGYLSDEEAENEENVSLTPETQKEKLKILQMEFEEEMKSKTERIKPRLIGCIWENKLKPKIQDAINAFLEERMMIINGPIVIKKRDLNKPNNKTNTGSKNSTPTRKQLPKDLIPDFLRLVHGNTNSKTLLINEFFNYMANKNIDIAVTKIGLGCQLNELAKWKRCPEKGGMFNKFCWYVNDDVRSQYNLNLVLPNKWSYANGDESSNAKKKLSL